MLISHRHRFIYIKTNKTGSTSVEIALSRYCDDPADVISALNAEAEAVRAEIGVAPRNFEAPWQDYRPRDVWRYLTRSGTRRLKARFPPHLGAADIKARIDPDIWASYTKIAIERNPWDKTISEYYWRTSKPRWKALDLDAFLKRYSGRFVHYNFPLYSIDGKVVADRLLRYEHLQEDLTRTLGELGIDYDGWMPRTKSGTRVDRRPYREVFTPAQAEFIARAFAKEIEVMGYVY